MSDIWTQDEILQLFIQAEEFALVLVKAIDWKVPVSPTVFGQQV